MPVVSVIVLVYNLEQTIGQALESVRAQTVQDLEIIVVNDGSTDRSREIISAIADERIKLFTYENGGIAVARNRGLQQVTGQFVAFLDGDDWWTADKLEYQLAALREHPEAVAAYSWSYFTDADGQVLYPQTPVRYSGDVYADLLVSNFLLSGSNILVRKPAMDAAGEFDADLVAAEDWYSWLKLAKLGAFVLVPKYQVYYRQSPQSFSSRLEVIEANNLKAIEKAFCEAPAELQYLKKKRLANYHQMVARLCLTRYQNRQGIRSARQHLFRSLRLCPAEVGEAKVQRLLMQWLVMQLLPVSVAKKLFAALTRWYGKFRQSGLAKEQL